MSEKEQREYLMIRLQRTDAWINSSDTKTSIILATVGVLLAILLNDRTFTVIENIFSYSIIFRLINIILIYIGVMYIFKGIMFLLKSLTPNLDKESESSSLHYFGDISEITFKRFSSNYKKQGLDEEIMDLLNQIHVNSIICKSKHDNLKAGISHSTIGFQVLFITILGNYLISLCII